MNDLDNVVVPDDISSLVEEEPEEKPEDEICHLRCTMCSLYYCNSVLGVKRCGTWYPGMKYCPVGHKMCLDCIKARHWTQKLKRSFKFSYNKCKNCKK